MVSGKDAKTVPIVLNRFQNLQVDWNDLLGVQEIHHNTWDESSSPKHWNDEKTSQNKHFDYKQSQEILQ